MVVFKELFENIDTAWSNHLEMEDNVRTLFSGRFGTGKTTFLKHFFKESSSKTHTIYLFPVNYSILDNEDIFSYIKYDILTSLLADQKYKLRQDHLSFLDKWDGFLLSNFTKIIATAMLVIPKLGKQLHKFVEELETLHSEFKKHTKTLSDKDMEEIHTFLNEFHQAEGGLYESNIITTLIQEWITDIKEDDKRVILVIDDLDRIDPNHIFRILNIFSAQFDIISETGQKNKFGFDQIILVCDINNISKIFNSQYGVDVDFNGYIDKFYSKEIFYFDNRENVFKVLDKILSKVNIQYDGEAGINDHPDSKIIKDRVKSLLYPLIENQKINLRSLFKFHNSTYTLRKNKHSVGLNTLYEYQNALLSAIRILTSMLGDNSGLKEKLESSPRINLSKDDRPDLIIGDIIFLHSTEEDHPYYLNDLHGRHSEWKDYNLQTIDKKKLSGKYMISGPRSGSILFTGIVEKVVDEDGTEIYDRMNREESIDAKSIIQTYLKAN